VDTGDIHVFREKEQFREFSRRVTLYIGHNILGYDYPVLLNLGWIDVLDVSSTVIDTLIISKLVDYSREGHSIEDYGLEFNYPKGHFSDFSKYSTEMEEYCKRDVEICHKIYLKYIKVIEGKRWQEAISLENRFQLVCNLLSKNGFYFNVEKAKVLLSKVQSKLNELDKDILTTFTPKLKLVREITPRITKHGTLNRNDFRWVVDGDLTPFNGGPFCLCKWETFNPASHKQLIDVLSAAGWNPTDRTRAHVGYVRERNKVVDKEKEKHYSKYGWKINENNLLSLPAKAPASARTLANRILYESRRRTLTEWIHLVSDDGRIHGDFQGIGAWTQRMSHQRPNTANIPNETDEQGRIKLLGGDLRQLWCAPKNRLLVGCDAEGIQLRIFAHYIDDPEFTKEVSEGDPHTLNMGVLGPVCRTRQAAKRFIYALLLGAGIGKLGEILEASREDTVLALDRILERYTGFAHLKDNVFPRDIRRGWFEGLDGRKVSIPNVQEKPHLVMSGYLQNGEAIVMKAATLAWMQSLSGDGLSDWKIVDLVHDEWQVECPNDVHIAIKIGQAQCDALRKVGEDLGLKCPLAGSFYNKKKQDYTIGTNWRVTH
jgi:DNA polymerase I-like protein with 3'-5' exonuclease and polymerase domains